jgi:hypothetical protein
VKRIIIIAAGLVALSSATASAAQSSRWALDINATSYHTEAWARHSLNQSNPGIGLEYQATSDWSGLAGFYRNSYRRTTGYALAAWTPLRVDLPAGLTASAGLAAGLVSGYRRDEVPTSPLAAGALLRIRDASGYGINLLAVPNTQSGSGFVGLQIVIPIR